MSSAQTRGRIAAALAVCAILFAFAGDGLWGYFTPDDMMNLYQAWSASPAALLHHDRPVGQVLYRAIFAVAGLHPLPFRIVPFVLLLANLALLYRFCLRLAGSREVGALACLLGAYHAHLADLYYSTGTIYDLLCCLFVLWAFDFYAGIRQTGRYPDWRQSTLLLVLYALALGSKEMAVTLPLYIAVYEALYQKNFALWLRRGAWWWWLSLPLTAWYVVTRIGGPHAVTANPAFAPRFSAHTFFAAWRHYLTDLFYGAIALNTAKVVLLLAGMLVFAIYSRRREMLIGWVVATAGALPVIFIQERGLYALYVTLPGWWLYAAALLVLSRNALQRRLPDWSAALDARPEQVLLYAAVLLLLMPIHALRKPAGNSWVEGDYRSVRSVLVPLDSAPPLRRGARVLFLADPFDPGDWILSHMFRLHYRDDSLIVDRVKDHAEFAAHANEYDRAYVLDRSGLHQIATRD
jgi:hypothetical protein